MIYLAVLLILSGLLIVIAALFIEKTQTAYAGKKPGQDVKDYGYSDPDEPDNVEVILPGESINRQQEIHDHRDEEDIFISFDDDINEAGERNKVQVDDDWGVEASDHVEVEPNVRISYKNGNDIIPVDSVEQTGSVGAIMFDDRSNIIDYESGGGMIDPTFAKYKSIKRIGKGRLEADSDGLNFFLGEKLYRFDYYKVYDIWSGKDYIALPLKGSSNVKLFLIENPGYFPDRVEQYFKEYEKGL